MTSACQPSSSRQPDLEELFFTPAQLAMIQVKKMPAHVAIIPDGNRRWAKGQAEKVQTGHRAGADTLMDTVKAAKQLGIKVLTFYVFSTENWMRDEEEIRGILWLLEAYLKEQRVSMVQNGVRLRTMGDLSRFPECIIASIEETKQITSTCDKIDLVLAMNYGARDEIRRSFQKILDDKVKKEDITEQLISSYLDNAEWGDPELLIRTSGEYRISNFLLWQLSYAEIYYTPILWPDFKPFHLWEAVIEFQKRDRRLGGGA